MQLAKELNEASRIGSIEDISEGSRYIQMSDTLAKEIARGLILVADLLKHIALIQ